MSRAGFSIVDQDFSPPNGGVLIQGTFLVSGAAGPGEQAGTTLAQTGLVPVGSQSLLFKAYFEQVRLNKPLPLAGDGHIH